MNYLANPSGTTNDSAADHFSFSLSPNAPTIEAELAARLAVAPQPGESPRYDFRGDGQIIMVGVDTPVLYSISMSAVQTCQNIRPARLPQRSGMCALSSIPTKVLVAQERDLCLFDLKSETTEPLLESVEPGHLPLRLNDGDVLNFENTDHPLHGFLVVGGISESKPRQPQSSLYAIEPRTYKKYKLLGGITNSNGLGTVNSLLVHTDTEARSICFYEFNGFNHSSALTKRKEISFDSLTASDSLDQSQYPKPDGLVIPEAEDMLIVSFIRMGKVIGLSLEGEHLFSVEVPAPLTASCELVGSQLYITTGVSPSEQNYPDSGHLFVADLSKLALPVQAKKRGIFQL